MTHHARLDTASRASAFHALAEQTFDVIVVGGGVTGAGIALDAASRGLSVALVEARDLASGTSQWSSKMVHGGLRYLVTYQFGIAHESAVERDRLLRCIAPHIVRPQRNLLPFVEAMSSADAALTGVGLGLADGLRRLARTPGSRLPRPGQVSAHTARTLLPAWESDGIRGGLTYWDCALEDDARLVVNLARTAAQYGAEVATYAKAEAGTDRTVHVRDELTGEQVVAHARAVVLATGVWAGQFTDEIDVVPSRGTHLVVEASRVGSPSDVVTIPAGERGRYVFFKPAPDGLVYIGLTDVEAPEADGWEPGTPENEVDDLLGAVNTVLREPLTTADLVGTFSGLRPLVRETGKTSADTSRDHVIVDRSGEPIIITGGKLTTYRAMAEQALDVVAGRLAHQGVRVPGCRTRTLPLLGAAPPEVLRSLPESARLVARYGTLASEVDALVAQDSRLGERVVEDSDVILAELVHGVLYEGACSARDLTDRRTRLSMRRHDVPAALAAAHRAFEWAGVEPVDLSR